jgi:Rieske Fe-S protein
MTMPDRPSRRAILLKLGIWFNAAVGAALAAPVLGYVLSSVIRQRRQGYDAWISLGSLDQFPAGQTRLATYQHPSASPSDGETANTPCWVRRLEGDVFQVFAINCAHLGCPVRWFPQSNLFLCPCHGGAYYQDGSRAAGPPERGMFEYSYKVEKGALFIKTGEMPNPGAPQASISGRSSSCA